MLWGSIPGPHVYLGLLSGLLDNIMIMERIPLLNRTLCIAFWPYFIKKKKRVHNRKTQVLTPVIRWTGLVNSAIGPQMAILLDGGGHPASVQDSLPQDGELWGCLGGPVG